MVLPSGAYLHRMLYRVLRAIRAMVTPGRIFRLYSEQEPPELAMSGEDLCHAESQDAVTSLQPRLKEGTYRRDRGVPSAGLRQSLFPCRHEIPPELGPPCRDLLRQPTFAPALHLHAHVVHGGGVGLYSVKDTTLRAHKQFISAQ